MNFFARNIDGRGRLVRGVLGLLLLVTGLVLAWRLEPKWPAVITFVSGGFVLFEALRGWCVMRACGVRTRL
jgi:uncharacterized membrane protein